jgi:hypothetical protein
LALAKELQWRPAGTTAPEGCDPEAWDEHGEYHQPLGQAMTSQDAQKFCQALEGAFYREPGEDDTFYEQTRPWSSFFPNAKDVLEKLIAFCRDSQGFIVEGWERVCVRVREEVHC